MDRTVLAWSGGKDAAMSLYRLLEAGESVATLWTTIGEETQRSSMHGVRRELYREQAAAIGLPIELTALPDELDNERYRAAVRAEYDRFAAAGATTIAYGDIELEGVRSFREATLADSPLDGCWPVWGEDTGTLVRNAVAAGFEAVVVAVDTGTVSTDLLGATLDDSLLDALPSTVDPGGEGGEYHTFVTNGPVFDRPVPVEYGRIVERDLGETTMAYLDLVPATDR